MKSNLRILLLFAAVFLKNAGINNGEYLPSLRLAHVMYRHGDRAPSRTYPTDPNQEEAWPGGWGSLTQLGVEQQYELGRYFRRYFGDFIDSTYDKNQIYVRSTDVDRTLMSAYSNLAGLYSTPDQQDGEIQNPLVPVHAPVPDPLDAMLNSNADCPRYSNLADQVYAGDESKEFQEENEEFLAMVKEKTGLGSDASLYDVAHTVPNAVKLERIHSMPQPDWVTDDVAEKLWTIRELQFKFYVYTPEMIAIRSALFYQELNTHLNDYISGKMDKQMKIYFYSAHDRCIITFLSALDIWDGKIPPFASSLMYELHERESGEFSIRVLYRNNTQSEATVLKIIGCDEFCPVNKFYEITQPFTWQSTWKDWYQMCESPETSREIYMKESSSKVILGKKNDDDCADEE